MPNLVEFLLKKKLKDLEDLAFERKFRMIFAGHKDEDIEKEIARDRKAARLYGNK